MDASGHRVIVVDMSKRSGSDDLEISSSSDESIDSSYEEDKAVEEYPMQVIRTPHLEVEDKPDPAPRSPEGYRKIIPKSTHISEDDSLDAPMSSDPLPGIAHPDGQANTMAMLKSINQKLDTMSNRMQHIDHRVARVENRQLVSSRFSWCHPGDRPGGR